MKNFAKNDKLENMEHIKSDIIDKVLQAADEYDYTKYTDIDVLHALSKDNLTYYDFGALLSPVAEVHLELMAQKAKLQTRAHFGNAIVMFTPLYIANYCVNHCVYCGFNCSNKINRGILSEREIEEELKAISKTGLKEILLLTGESRYQSDVEYIGRAIEIAKLFFSTIGLEVYPMNTEEYAYLHEKGADFVSVYQETYNTVEYDKVHLSGPKKVFKYRFHSQERALRGGMRGVAVGALLGLDDFRKDAFATGIHATLLQKKYPYGEFSFSTPRLRPIKNNDEIKPKDVNERQLLQVLLSYRLMMPFAGITISTREKASFRNNVVGMVATKISAGVKTGVGGHEEVEKGDAQFEISDERSVYDVKTMLIKQGLQPVFTDYIRV